VVDTRRPARASAALRRSTAATSTSTAVRVPWYLIAPAWYEYLLHTAVPAVCVAVARLCLASSTVQLYELVLEYELVRPAAGGTTGRPAAAGGGLWLLGNFFVRQRPSPHPAAAITAHCLATAAAATCTARRAGRGGRRRGHGGQQRGPLAGLDRACRVWSRLPLRGVYADIHARRYAPAGRG
jgi:hypothetical protein